MIRPREILLVALMIATAFPPSSAGGDISAKITSGGESEGENLDVGLLFDDSDATRASFLAEQAESEIFLRQIVTVPGTWAFVLSFDEVATLEQRLTHDSARLARAIKHIRPGGGCAIWDAVFNASKEILGPAASSGHNRRALVLILNNEDNQSKVTLEQAINAARASVASVYVITEDGEDPGLARLTKETGGRAFFKTPPARMRAAFTKIADEFVRPAKSTR